MINPEKKKIELLSPGGDVLSVKAAVLAGADAVFLGVGQFNARKRAVNISLKELTELCGIARQRDVRLYLTLNILTLESELPELMQLLADAVQAGIDAVILQDYGLLYTIRKVFPDLELHASTQMTTHNCGQLELLAQAGVSQVNLSRELSLAEIEHITEDAHRLGMKVEVFVHGAYCVSFSGQCYMSGNMYQNSANRGACVQPCRREYSGNSRYLRPLNLKDNSVFSSAAELINAGVDSLKIEGRIKGYEYVFNTTRAWREQLDRLTAGETPLSVDPRLDAVFNRSFSDNLIKGRLGEDSFTEESEDKSLKLMDRIVSYSADRKELTVQDGSTLQDGCQITIKTIDGDFVCTGSLEKALSSGVFRLKIEHVLKGKIQRGQQIWSQPLSERKMALEQSILALTWTREKLPINFKLSGAAGAPLILNAASAHKDVSVSSDILLEKAETRPTSPEAVLKQLARLGESPFFLENCDLTDLKEGLFIPVKLLNQMRRKAVEQLTGAGMRRTLEAVLSPVRSKPESVHPCLALILDDPAMFSDLPDGRSVKLFFSLPADPEVLYKVEHLFREYRDLIPWFPSILIGDQFEAACNFIDRYSFSQIVTDNSGIAWYAAEKGIPWTAGPLLNGSNGYSLEFFRENGASAAVLSSELSGKQTSALSIPEGMALWSILISPVLLMKTRHCIARNCSSCGKKVMDSACLPDCERTAEISDSQGNSILVVKKSGEYNSLYMKNSVLRPHVLEEGRTGVYLLDLRSPAKNILQDISLKELIGLAEKTISPLHVSSRLSGAEILLHRIPSLSSNIPGGLE